MASTQMTQEIRPFNSEAHERPGYRRLGTINGFLIGLALALGAWVAQAISLARLPIRHQHPSLVLGGILLVIVCTVAGWLTSRWARPGLTILLWSLAATLATLIIAFQPSFGRNLVAWLSDSRFWGRQIYPGLSAPLVPILITGFAIYLVLLILAVIQNYRLEGAQRELKNDGRMSLGSLVILIWPMLFVALAGWTANNITGDKAAHDALLVQEAINTGRTYDGDLFELGAGGSVNYGAISAVREQMSPTYSLLIGSVDSDALTTLVVAHFANGAWITCRVINDQLNFCYDAALPYTTGLANLINGETGDEDCRNCLPQVEEETAAWLHGQRERLGENPTIERLAQMGSHVLMRVTSASEDQAIDCWFSGLSPVKLESCVEADL